MPSSTITVKLADGPAVKRLILASRELAESVSAFLADQSDEGLAVAGPLVAALMKWATANKMPGGDSVA